MARQGQIISIVRSGVPWYHLSNAHPPSVQTRLDELEQLHRLTLDHGFTLRVGQTLEIAVFRALCSQGVAANQN
jgi:hypothetical protein